MVREWVPNVCIGSCSDGKLRQVLDDLGSDVSADIDAACMGQACLLCTDASLRIRLASSTSAFVLGGTGPSGGYTT